MLALYPLALEKSTYDMSKNWPNARANLKPSVNVTA